MGQEVGSRSGTFIHNLIENAFSTDRLQPSILIIVSGAFLAGSTNIGEFLFFRFVSGAGTFMILAAVPVSPTDELTVTESNFLQIWMNEVVPEHIRGCE
jgi:hypothetical protein